MIGNIKLVQEKQQNNKRNIISKLELIHQRIH